MVERHEAVVRTGAAIAGLRHQLAVVLGEAQLEVGLDRSDPRGRQRRRQAVGVVARAEAAALRSRVSTWASQARRLSEKSVIERARSQ